MKKPKLERRMSRAEKLGLIKPKDLQEIVESPTERLAHFEWQQARAQQKLTDKKAMIAQKQMRIENLKSKLMKAQNKQTQSRLKSKFKKTMRLALMREAMENEKPRRRSTSPGNNRKRFIDNAPKSFGSYDASSKFNRQRHTIGPTTGSGLRREQRAAVPPLACSDMEDEGGYSSDTTGYESKSYLNSVSGVVTKSRTKNQNEARNTGPRKGVPRADTARLPPPRSATPSPSRTFGEQRKPRADTARRADTPNNRKGMPRADTARLAPPGSGSSFTSNFSQPKSSSWSMKNNKIPPPPVKSIPPAPVGSYGGPKYMPGRAFSWSVLPKPRPEPRRRDSQPRSAGTSPQNDSSKKSTTPTRTYSMAGAFQAAPAHEKNEPAKASPRTPRGDRSMPAALKHFVSSPDLQGEAASGKSDAFYDWLSNHNWQTYYRGFQKQNVNGVSDLMMMQQSRIIEIFAKIGMDFDTRIEFMRIFQEPAKGRGQASRIAKQNKSSGNLSVGTATSGGSTSHSVASDRTDERSELTPPRSPPPRASRTQASPPPSRKRSPAPSRTRASPPRSPATTRTRASPPPSRTRANPPSPKNAGRRTGNSRPDTARLPPPRMFEPAAAAQPSPAASPVHGAPTHPPHNAGGQPMTESERQAKEHELTQREATLRSRRSQLDIDIPRMNPYAKQNTFDYQGAAALSMANAQSTVDAAHNIVKQANQTVAAAAAVVKKHNTQSEWWKEQNQKSMPAIDPKLLKSAQTINYVGTGRTVAPPGRASLSLPDPKVTAFRKGVTRADTARLPQSGSYGGYTTPEVPRSNTVPLPPSNLNPPSFNYLPAQSPNSTSFDSVSTSASPSSPTDYQYDTLPIVPTGTKMVLVEDAGAQDANGDYIFVAEEKKYVKESGGMRHEISSAKDKSGFTNWWLYRCDRNGINGDVDYYVVRSNSVTPPLRGWKKLPKGKFPCPKVRYYKKA